MREIFNQTDIDANRQGKLSPSQVEFIKASVNPVTWVWGAGICFILGVPVYLLSDGFAGPMGIIGWVMALVMLVCLGRLALMWNLRRKLLSEPIQSMDGDVTFKKLDALDTLRYNPETSDGQRLLLQGLGGLSAMLPPGDYRFYYLPTRKWLLSSEPLSSEAELIANMVAILGNVLGFNPNDLPGLREQAAAGAVKTAEGHVQIEVLDSVGSDVDLLTGDQACAEIGGVEFFIPPEAANAFIGELRYRVYYYEKKPTDWFSKIRNVTSNTYIAGIEPM